MEASKWACKDDGMQEGASVEQYHFDCSTRENKVAVSWGKLCVTVMRWLRLVLALPMLLLAYAHDRADQMHNLAELPQPRRQHRSHMRVRNPSNAGRISGGTAGLTAVVLC